MKRMKENSPRMVVDKGPLSLPSPIVDWLQQVNLIGENRLNAGDCQRLRSGNLVYKLALQVLGCDIDPTNVSDKLDRWRAIISAVGDFAAISPCNPTELAQGNDQALIRLMEELYQVYVSMMSNLEAMDHPPVIAVSVTEADVSNVRRNLEANTLGMFMLETMNSKLVMGLGVEEIAALLSGANTAYLFQLLRVGPKRSLKAVQEWVDELYVSRELLAELVLNGTRLDDMLGFLRLLGVLLFSSDEVVLIKTLSILREIFLCVDQPEVGEMLYNFSKQDYVATCWSWLRSLFGLNALVTCWKRNVACREVICDVLEVAGRIDDRSNFKSFFCVDLHQPLISSSAYMDFTHDLIQVVDKKRHGLAQELSKRDIPAYLAKFAGRCAEPKMSIKVRRSAIGLLAQVWLTFTKDIERDPALPKSILVILNKGLRESKDITLQIFSLSIIFHMLEMFALQHKPFAPYLYKTIIFSLIEFHRHEMLRDFIITNLSQCLQKMAFAPVGVLVVPLVKQISLHGFSNMDLGFLHILAKHQRLEVNDALRISDLCAKIALNDPVFGRASTDLLLVLIKRFSLNQAVLKFVFRVFDAAAKILSQNQVPDLQRSLIMDVLAKIISLQITDVNNQVESILHRNPQFQPLVETLSMLRTRHNPQSHHGMVEEDEANMWDDANFNAINQEYSQPQQQRQQHRSAKLPKEHPNPPLNSCKSSTSNVATVGEDLVGSQQIVHPEGHQLVFEEMDLPISRESAVAANEEYYISDEEETKDEQYPDEKQMQMISSYNQRQQPQAQAHELGNMQQKQPQQQEQQRRRKPRFKPTKVDPNAAIASQVMKKAQPKFTGMLTAFAYLDPADTGYVDKVKLLQMINAQDNNPGVRALMSCPYSRVLRDRKLQDTVRRFSSTKAGSIGIWDMESILKDYFRGKQQSSRTVSVNTRAGKMQHQQRMQTYEQLQQQQPSRATRKVQEDIERLYQMRKEQEDRKQQEEEERRMKDRERRRRARDRFDKQIQARKERELIQLARGIEVTPQQATQNKAVEFEQEVRAIGKFDNVLKSLFHHAVAPGQSLNSALGKSFDELRDMQGRLSVHRWLRFLRSFKIVPQLLKQDEGKVAFFKGKTTSTRDASFDEFVNALAYCAAQGFAFEANATSRAYSLMSLLRKNAIEDAPSNLKHEHMDPVQRKIILSLAELDEVPDFQHLCPEGLVENPDRQQSVSVALGIIDDILSSTFNIHILMPVPTSAEGFKAQQQKVIQQLAKSTKRREHVQTVPVDTKLYPQEKIETEKKKIKPVVYGNQGFGSSYKPKSKKDQAQQKRPKNPHEWNEKERSFMNRLAENNEKLPKHMKTEDAKREEEARKKRAEERQRKRLMKRQEELRKLQEEQLAKKLAREAEEAKQKLEQEQKALAAKQEKERKRQARLEKQKKMLEEHLKKKQEEEAKRQEQERLEKEKERQEVLEKFKEVKAKYYEIKDDQDVEEDAKALDRETAAALAKRKRELRTEKLRLKQQKEEQELAARLQDKRKKFDEKLRKKREMQAKRANKVASQHSKEQEKLAEKRRKVDEEMKKKSMEAQAKLEKKKQTDERRRQEALERKKKIDQTIKDFDATATKELKKLGAGIDTPPNSPKSPKSPQSPKVPGNVVAVSRDVVSPNPPSEFEQEIKENSKTTGPAPVNDMYPQIAEGEEAPELPMPDDKKAVEEAKDVAAEKEETTAQTEEKVESETKKEEEVVVVEEATPKQEEA